MLNKFQIDYILNQEEVDKEVVLEPVVKLLLLLLIIHLIIIIVQLEKILFDKIY